MDVDDLPVDFDYYSYVECEDDYVNVVDEGFDPVYSLFDDDKRRSKFGY